MAINVKWKEISRTLVKRGGVDITVLFSDSAGRNEEKTMHFIQDTPSSATILKRMEHNANKFVEKNNQLLHGVQLPGGDDIRDITEGIKTLVSQTPSCTKEDIIAMIDTKFDTYAKAEKIFTEIEEQLNINVDSIKAIAVSLDEEVTVTKEK